MKFSTNLALLLAAAAAAGALAPEPTLLISGHALLMVLGVQLARVVERA